MTDVESNKKDDKSTKCSCLRWARKTYIPSTDDYDYLPESPAGIWNKVSKIPLFENYHFKNLSQCAWILTGCMISLSIIGVLDNYVLRPIGYPIMYAALGASATIMFQMPSNPFTQPYHIIVGHTICPALGVTAQKLFPNLPWLAASIATSLSIAIMGLFGGVNPPGGALALLYPIVNELHVLGYMYIPGSLFGIVIMFIVGFVINNLQRNVFFPHQWL